MLRPGDDVLPREAEHPPAEALEVVEPLPVPPVGGPVGVVGEAVRLDDKPERGPAEVHPGKKGSALIPHHVLRNRSWQEAAPQQHT